MKTSRLTRNASPSRGASAKEIDATALFFFVFVEDSKMIIQVGYGLEGALPDATAFNITEYLMKPEFVSGNYEAGLHAGIESILNTIRGEYSGRCHLMSDGKRHHVIGPFFIFGFLFVLSLLGGLHRKARRGVGISSKGSRWTIDWGDVFFWLSVILSGRSSGSSGGSSSSSSGFSGGGGSFGGGGAGSSW